MTTLRHHDNYGTARFVTFSCFRRYRLLTDRSAIEIFLEELRSTCDSDRLRLLGYVVMPNHVHLVLNPTDEVPLGRVIGKLKSNAARRILPVLRNQNGFRTDRLYGNRDGELRPVFWQKRCYDHNCRTRETTLEKIEYCHKNPVRSGLVSHPSQWRWSSYNWYEGVEDVPIEVDGVRI